MPGEVGEMQPGLRFDGMGEGRGWGRTWPPGRESTVTHTDQCHH